MRFLAEFILSSKTRFLTPFGMTKNEGFAMTKSIFVNPHHAFTGMALGVFPSGFLIVFIDGFTAVAFCVGAG